MKLINLCVFLIAFVVSSCGGFQPPAEPAPRTGKVIDVSFDKAWNAVIDVFAEKNISIKTLDRSSGLIVAERGSISSNQYLNPDIVNWSDCGGFSPTMRVYANRVGYNILVRGDSVRSTIKANFVFEHIGTGQYSSDFECVSKGVLEDVWEERISQIALTK